MKANMGTIDRAVRAILGLVIIVWGLMAGNWLGLIGLVLLATAVTSVCPAYSVLGINSCKK